MNSALEIIITRQMKWAEKNNIKFDNDHYISLGDPNLEKNLLRSLGEETDKEFREGSGDEIRAKMWSLRSSSALVVNFFNYFRPENKTSEILRILKANKNLGYIKFKGKYPAGLRGSIAHLDVIFTDSQEISESKECFAIEAKFAEPYDRRNNKKFSDPYFKREDIWEELKGCKKIADNIRDGKKNYTYKYLDAVQLLKHIVALNRKYKEKNKYRLLYLWYKVEDANTHIESKEHLKEIEHFEKQIDSEVNLSSITYQELFQKIKEIKVSDNKFEDYKNYLAERYF